MIFKNKGFEMKQLMVIDNILFLYSSCVCGKLYKQLQPCIPVHVLSWQDHENVDNKCVDIQVDTMVWITETM